MSYAELQVTTNFSFLRGASHPDEMMVAAAALGLAAIAVTDRNSLAGVVRAHAAAKRLGLRLVVGTRLDLTDGASLLCYPTGLAGYGRLCRLLTLGKRRAGKGDCLLGRADVVEHGEGQIIIVLPPDRLDREFAAELTAWGQAFAGRCFLGGQVRFSGDDARRLARLAALSERCGPPLVALNDVHYHSPERRAVQDVLTCIREGCTIAEAGWRLAPHAERHLKSPGEMARLFARHPQAVARTMEIAEACRFSLEELAYQYPVEAYKSPRPLRERAPSVSEGVRGTRVRATHNPVFGKKIASVHPHVRPLTQTLSRKGRGLSSPQERLIRLTWEGAARRYPDGVPPKVQASLDHELTLIGQLAYAPYFLTVHDIVSFAESRGILCQGRGSAANSAVCFCLGITGVDPAQFDLLFERFVSAARDEPPDIDVDFEHERREEVIQYLYARHGRERAGLAATVIHYRRRSAIREVGKVMGMSDDTVTALTRASWGGSRQSMQAKDLREHGLDPADPAVARVMALAGAITGFPRHLSQHVGGFVITRDRLDEMVPIANAAMDGRTVIEWDKDDLDAVGMLKIDVLALGMLTCIRKAFDLLRAHRQIDLGLATVPREDPKVYDMLCRADSLGVFQVESRAQMTMLPRLKPRCFYDLVIEVAIVRPGPIQGDMVHPYLRRREGKEKVEYPSAELEAVLGKTLGVPLFQEQAMKIAIVAGGFTPGEADQLRRAMATFRHTGVVSSFRDKLVEGMVGKGYQRDFAERVFKQIEGFGEYGFPESHAASFAHLVYVSAWLKCHHPAVFACALLNSQPMGFYAPAQIVRDVREHGVEVRPVDVNASLWDCGLEGRALRLGFRQIGGLRQSDAEALVLARKGGYDSPHTLWRRSGLSAKALEVLAQADAYGSLGLTRREALWAVKAFTAPPPPLFAAAGVDAPASGPKVTLPSMSLGEEVVEDYTAIRMSLKLHPLALLRDQLTRMAVMPAARLAQRSSGAVSVAGLVLVRQRPGTASGVIFLTLEDETGVANIVVWPKLCEQFRKAVLTGKMLRIDGKLQREGIVIHVVAERILDLTPSLQALTATEMPHRSRDFC